MKIGIFDSGLGGLVIAKAIFKKLPKYDYVYLGDTKNLPYGNRSSEQVYKFTRTAVKYLFEQDCQLVILACNTASALALRKIQQEFLPKFYPERRVLGVVIPTLEKVDGKYHSDSIGILATSATAKSHIYKKELVKINPRIKIYEQEAPLLVTLIEQNALPRTFISKIRIAQKNNSTKLNPNNYKIQEMVRGLQYTENALKSYLKPLLNKKVEAIVLACTHYPILQKEIEKIVGKKIKVISQTDFLPGKLQNYLSRHKEISSKLSKKGKKEFLVTSQSKNFEDVAKRLFGKKLKFKVVNL